MFMVLSDWDTWGKWFFETREAAEYAVRGVAPWHYCIQEILE